MKKYLVTIFFCVIAASQLLAVNIVENIGVKEPTASVREMADVSVHQPSTSAVTTYDSGDPSNGGLINSLQSYNLFFASHAKGSNTTAASEIWTPEKGNNSPISSFLSHFNDIFIHTNNVTMASNSTVSASAIRGNNAVPTTTFGATDLGSTKSSRPTVDPIGRMPIGNGVLPLLLLVFVYALFFLCRNIILNKKEQEEK